MVEEWGAGGGEENAFEREECRICGSLILLNALDCGSPRGFAKVDTSGDAVSVRGAFIGVQGGAESGQGSTSGSMIYMHWRRRKLTGNFGIDVRRL